MLSTTQTRPHDWQPVYRPRELPQEHHADLGLTDVDHPAGGDSE